jgi:hypothetical protein
MKIEKIVLDHIERCYCSAVLEIDGECHLVLAGEAEGGPCYAYSGPRFSHREVVWEHGGGTMSLVQIPGGNNGFLAVQNFFPGFRSETAKIVRGRREKDGRWTVEDYLALPFIHRFDIFSVGGENWFLGCVLCASKKDREDWSDPGYVAVGRMPGDGSPMEPPTVILSGLTKNHGYCRGTWEGRPAGYVACEEGVYAVIPPSAPGSGWTTALLMDRPVSDMAFCDLDGDGREEMVTIEPFHGDTIQVYRLDGGVYSPVYRYPGKVEFAHALAGCALAGRPCVVCGVRRADAELSFLFWDREDRNYRVERIEAGVGPSNVAVVRQAGRDLILSANHTANEGAVYLITD